MALNLDFKMTFYINWIKEDKNKANNQVNLEFLVFTDDENQTRELTSRYWIIVLSVQEFLWDERQFGSFYFEVNQGLNIIRIVPKKETKALQEICRNYLKVWFEISWIKDYWGKLTELNVKEIIYESRKILEQEKNIQKTIIEKQQEKDKQFFEDKPLEKLKEVIKRILPRCNEILWVLSDAWELSPKSLREVKDLEENIKKLSMWTNSEKIKDSLDKLFSKIEEMEQDYYKILKRNWEKVFQESVITHFDILKEDYKLQYAKNKNKAWLSINTNDQYYLIFWKLWVFGNFLKTDLLNKAVDLDTIVKKIYDLIELSILFIICEIVFYLIILYFIDDSKMQGLIVILINTAIIWLSFSFLKMLFKNHKYLFYSVIPLCLILFFLIKRFTISNFAL